MSDVRSQRRPPLANFAEAKAAAIAKLASLEAAPEPLPVSMATAARGSKSTRADAMPIIVPRPWAKDSRATDRWGRVHWDMARGACSRSRAGMGEGARRARPRGIRGIARLGRNRTDGLDARRRALRGRGGVDPRDRSLSGASAEARRPTPMMRHVAAISLGFGALLIGGAGSIACAGASGARPPSSAERNTNDASMDAKSGRPPIPTKPYFTKLGRQYIEPSEVIVLGRVRGVSPIPSGPSVVRFEVERWITAPPQEAKPKTIPVSAPPARSRSPKPQ